MPYTFHADDVETDVQSRVEGIDDRQINWLQISFRTTEARVCHTLILSREYQNTDGADKFVGEPEIYLSVDDWEATTTGGIRIVELSRDRIRIVLAAKAAKLFDGAEMIITFDIDEDEFEIVSRDLGNIFADKKYYRGLEN
jgi:hypothetical protein